MTALLKDGELNTSFIQRELVDALEEDRTYHITDEAKKKHITTAASYDEFRHLVACADLKRVTRKEMDFLGKPEKGWKTKGNLVTGTRIGKRGTKDVKGKKGGATQIEKCFPVVPPKNPMAFDRDWRRHCSSLGHKLQYLRLCGASTLRKIFRTELDVALMAEIIKVCAATASWFRNNAAVSGGGNEEGVAAENPGSFLVDADEVASALEIFSYLCILPETGRFSLNVEFLEESDRADVASCVGWLASLLLVEQASGSGCGDAECVHGRDAQENSDRPSFTRKAVFRLLTAFQC